MAKAKKSNKVVRTWQSYERDAGRKFTEVSQTVPNQSLSIKEVIERFTAGKEIKT